MDMGVLHLSICSAANLGLRLLAVSLPPLCACIQVPQRLLDDAS